MSEGRPPRSDDRERREDRPDREGGGYEGRGPGGPGGSRGPGGPGGPRRGPRSDRPMSTKARLRAKARKKARKAAKKRGGGQNRKKVCRFCADKNLNIEYKDPKTLRYFMTETGKLIPQRISGNCAKHQRSVASAVKRARHLALMPYSPQHI